MRIGYTLPGRSWHYTVRVPRSRVLGPRHSVVNQWDLLAALDIAPPTPACDPTLMVESADARARIEERLRRAGVVAGEPLVVIHVSAGNAFRKWPLPSFVELIAGLAARDRSRRFLVTSGPSDEGARQRVMRDARLRLGSADARAVVDAGELDLAELHAALGRAALFIGPDSGPLHIASTTAVPIVGLYGPTLPERSAPWRDPVYPVESIETTGLACRPCDQRVCEPGDFRCLTRLTPARVAEAAERALDQGTLVRAASGRLP
jgi:ADP-heptose:LPS heptosyltransferase